MKQIVRIIAAGALSMLAGSAFAQDKSMATPAAQGRGAADVVTVTATVESIDQKTRTVTLKDSKGKLHAFVAGEDVRNLAQVQKGDVVTLDYAQAVGVRLAKSASKTRERTVTEGMERAALGQKPGGVAYREVNVIASVEGIDAKKQMVTLRGPQNTVSIKVEDPAMLKVEKGKK